MADNLVIVESPAKAGTIAKYLGSNFEVLASMGHIRDLPTSKIGVDVTANFLPSYIVPLKAKKTLKSLKAALKNKKRVYLATDLDREGEAIAWHIAQALELESSKIEVERITFDEITKPAILEAVAHPRALNMQLIDAQQARRILDRLVGYTLSPLLWRKIYKGLSAGRVQSVALRLIVERERERDAFKPEEYWSLKVRLNTLKKEELLGQLFEFDGKKIEQLTLKSETDVQTIINQLEKAQYIVKSKEAKKQKRRPSAPYTTSTFQQDAVNKLGLGARKAMSIAQRLYEAGHITYMRTDSVSIASVAVDAIREHVKAQYGANYLPAKPPVYLSKQKGAQEAHEAIRPTNPVMHSVSITGEPQAAKVYELIWKRAVASQMAEAELEQQSIIVEANKGLFKVTGQRILFPGFLEAWGRESDDQILPEVTVGEQLLFQELLPEQHFTEPPPRYSEATLIKILEEHGIGRPSTYAPIISTLQERKYVTVEQRRLLPEHVGYLVTDMLTAHFPEIVDTAFTAGMEERLDEVAEGKTTYQKVLQDFWDPFNKHIEENSDKIEKIDTTEESDEICPTCGSPMIIRMGRFGKFLACSKFPECKTTKPLAQPSSGLICPICGKPLNQRRAKRGVFFGCSGYPDCKFAIWKKEQLVAKIEELEKEGVALPHKEEALKALEPTA